MKSRTRSALGGRRLRVIMLVAALSVFALLSGSESASASTLAQPRSTLAQPRTAQTSQESSAQTTLRSAPTPGDPQCGPDWNWNIRTLPAPGEAAGACLHWYDLEFPVDNNTMTQWAQKNGIDNPSTGGFLGAVLSFIWKFYVGFVGIFIVLYRATDISWWLDGLSKPAQSVQDAVQQFLHAAGIVPLLLVVAAILSGVWMLRGRWAGGLGELAASLVCATFAVSSLSGATLGLLGQEGLLVRADFLSLQMGGRLLASEPGIQLPAGTQQRLDAIKPDPAARKDLLGTLASSLATISVEYPFMVAQFGTSVPDNCRVALHHALRAHSEAAATVEAESAAARKDYTFWEGLWHDPTGLGRALGTHPGKTVHQIAELHGLRWTTEQECSQFVAQMDKPMDTMERLAMVVFVCVGGLILITFLMAMCVAQFVAATRVTLETAMLALTVTKGILPGFGREKIFYTLTSVAAALATLLAIHFAIVEYVIVVRRFLQGDTGSITLRWFWCDLLTVGLVIGFSRHRTQLNMAMQRWAEQLTRSTSPISAGALPAPHATRSDAWRQSDGVGNSRYSLTPPSFAGRVMAHLPEFYAARWGLRRVPIARRLPFIRP